MTTGITMYGYDVTIVKHVGIQSTCVYSSSDRMREALEDYDPYRVLLRDTKYKLVNIDKLKEKLSVDDLDKRKYDLQKFDCNRFTYVLLGRIKDWDGELAFGKAVIKEEGSKTAHMLNVLIDEHMNLYFCEPQTDGIALVEMDVNKYTIYELEF